MYHAYIGSNEAFHNFSKTCWTQWIVLSWDIKNAAKMCTHLCLYSHWDSRHSSQRWCSSSLCRLSQPTFGSRCLYPSILHRSFASKQDRLRSIQLCKQGSKEDLK